MSIEDNAQFKMDEILFGHGLQTTLTTLIFSLRKMIDKRGHSIEGVMVLEGLKGLLKGYLSRYEDQYQVIRKENDD